MAQKQDGSIWSWGYGGQLGDNTNVPVLIGIRATCKEQEQLLKEQLLIPNVFTPGKSPNKDFFFPSIGIEEFECTVFNRYAVKVFEFNNILDKWDGNNYRNDIPCIDGVYYFSYQARSTSGIRFNGEGQVMLLRDK